MREENQRLEGHIHHLQDLANQDQAMIQRVQQEAAKWKTKFSDLAEFANNSVQGIPRMHREAYVEILPNNMPTSVFDFVEVCGTMLKEFKASLEAARKAKL
jgi:hypothetical protein